MDGVNLVVPDGIGQLVQSSFVDVIRDLPMFNILILTAIVLIVMALAVTFLRKKRKKRLVNGLLVQQKAMENAEKGLFSDRKADDIQEVVADPGVPVTILPEGSVAYTETGEMLVFGSAPAADAADAVAAAVGRKREPDKSASMAYMPTYRLEKVIALHITGVVMFFVGGDGRIHDGRETEPELIVVLERLIERARWLGGEMVSGVYGDRTVALCWGGDIHMAAVVDGEPDQHLDRELRWAIGDLVDEFSEEIWSWGDEGDASMTSDALVARMRAIFRLTLGVSSSFKVSSVRKDLRATSTVAYRNSMIEYVLGVSNYGPGPVDDVEVIPILSKDHDLQVVSIEGVTVGADNKFRITRIEEGEKVTASFIFRALEPSEARLDCSVLYVRGVADVSSLKLPPRFIRFSDVALEPGDPVEPERVFELATQPAAFRDRCALYIPPGSDNEHIFSGILELMVKALTPVVELEDDEDTQLEAWFHADLGDGGDLVASVSVMADEGLIDLYAASTESFLVPIAMLRLRRIVDNAMGEPLSEVLDPEVRTTVPRAGVLLFESWGSFFDE